MLTDSAGQEFIEGYGGMVCVCSVMSGATAGKTGMMWKHLHSLSATWPGPAVWFLLDTWAAFCSGNIWMMPLDGTILGTSGIQG